MKILGREVRITGKGVELEVDGKYLQQALAAYGLVDCKAAATPATKEGRESHEASS